MCFSAQGANQNWAVSAGCSVVYVADCSKRLAHISGPSFEHRARLLSKRQRRLGFACCARCVCSLGPPSVGTCCALSVCSLGVGLLARSACGIVKTVCVQHMTRALCAAMAAVGYRSAMAQRLECKARILLPEFESRRLQCFVASGD